MASSPHRTRDVPVENLSRRGGDAYALPGVACRTLPVLSQLLRHFALLFGLALLSPLPLFAQQVLFDQSSDPAGFIATSKYIEAGTNILTTSAPLESSGYRFSYWTLNGMRQNDPLGRARNPVRFMIYEDTYAVAHYLPNTNDLDADGISDWFEILFFSSTNNAAASDTDADGYTLDTEFQRDYHPGLKDEIQDGGISRRRSLLKTVIFNPAFFLFTEVSAPLGFIDRQQVVSNGVVAATTLLNGDASGYSFGYWDVNGVRQQDITCRALARPQITVTNTTLATAHYFPTTDDTEGDGLQDWWEWLYFGTLTNSPNTDADGDGYDQQTELNRDYHPGLKDEIQDGGISRRRSLLVDVNLAGFFPYTLSSQPPGFLQQSGYAVTGTVIKTAILNGESAGYFFAYWTVNGVRQADPVGQALSRATFTVTTNMDVVAWYYSKTEDTDGDGIPDWWEWQTLGSLSYGPTDDPDGDGYDLLTEYNRSYQPGIGDVVQDGGISRRRSELVAVDMQFFERVEYALVSSNLTRFYTVWPSNITGYAFGPNSTPAAGDWDGNGTPDLFIGSSNGTVTIYENIGTKYTLNVTNRTAAFDGIAGGWAGIPNTAPALGDWNGDGKADLAVGGDAGRVRLVMSTGHFGYPQIPPVAYDLIVTGSIRAVPAFGSITAGGKPDLLVLVDDGTIRAYTNTGNASMPYVADCFVGALLEMPVLNGNGLGVADVNADGRPDVLVSDSEGRIWDFLGSADSAWILKSKVWAGSGRGMAQRLTVGPVDMDGDGDIDALCGFAGGGMMHLRDPRLGVPTNLRAFSGPRSVRLEWDPNREFRIKGYYVYRADAVDGAYARVTPQWISNAQYLDTGATIGVTNYYRVTSVTYSAVPGTAAPVEKESRMSEPTWGVAGMVAVTMPDYVGSPGSNAVLSLNIANARGIVGNVMELRITYDPACVCPASQFNPTVPTVEKTLLTTGLSISDNASTANGVLVIQGTGVSEIAGDGRIFDVVWHVRNTAVAGAAVTNTISFASLRDTAGSPVTVDISDRAVLTIEGVGTIVYFRGDINGDGILSQDDFVLAMQLAVGQRPATPKELMAGDLNGNGAIDKDDAHLVLRMIHGQKVNP
jgi:hypothetical protein